MRSGEGLKDDAVPSAVTGARQRHAQFTVGQARKESLMRAIVFTASVVVILQVAASLAQQSPPSEPAHKVYVMTGCLQRGSASTSVFTLADATAVGQAPPEASSDTDGRVVAGTRSYDLLPVSSVSEQGINRETLESHVANRVEVTVRPVETSATPTTSTPNTTVAKVEQSTPRRYTVVKISKASGSCQVERR